MVEGYTDVLALHQAGIRESVAIMGTALTAEQMAELGRAAPLVVLALDADRSGQEAMVRAAQHGGVELQAVAMPEGSDPADLLVSEGEQAFAARLEAAMPMVQFQIRRVLADAELGTPTGRDKALEEARGLIAATPERTAMRDELVREVADRLDVPTEYVRAPRRFESGTARASAGKVALGAEQSFLAACLASGELGVRYLGLAADEQFSSETMLRARDHLAAHFEDPLAGLSEDDGELGKLINDVVQAALALPVQPESTLRTSILQLEGRRIDREIRRAASAGDHARQTELAAAAQRVREEMGQIVGQTA